MASAPDIDRIKRNIGRMIEQDAPETDIENYIKTEGVTADQLRASKSAPAPSADERPWYSKLGSAADDMARIGANAMTFGYADKLAGALGGEGTEAERAKTGAARDRAGSASYAADIGGGLATGMGLANSGVTAMRLVPQGMKGLAGLGARTGAMAVDGTAYGALSATGNDTDVAQGALFGGAAGAIGNVAGEGISRGISKVAGAFNKQPQLPTGPELRSQTSAAYKAADDAGIILTPDAARNAKTTIVDELTNMGYHPKLQPKIAAVLDEMDRVAEGNVTLKGYDTIRKIASGAYEPGNKSNNAMVGKIVRALDDNPIENNVLAGDVAGIGKVKEARGLNARAAKSETVEFAMEKAARNAKATGSGGNLDNEIRKQFRTILNSPAKKRGFSKDELAAMEDVIGDKPTREAARLLGKLSPSGNGLMLALQAGAAGASGGMTLPLAGAGVVAKKLAEKGTEKSVDDLVRIIAAGGKRSDAFAPPNAVQRLSEAKREALIRALLGGSIPTLTGAE